MAKRGRKKSTKTENQRLYEKEIKRLKAGIRYYTKQGFRLYKDGADFEPFGEKPKRITKKALEKIRNIKPKDIIKQGIYVDYETGEIMPAEKRLEQIKRQAVRLRKRARDKKDAYKEESQYTLPEEDNYLPTITMLNSIRKMLSEIPSYRFVGYNISIPTGSMRDELLRILDDNYEASVQEGTADDYIDFLYDNEAFIFNYTLIIIYDSDEAKILNGVSQIAQIFNYGAVLSHSQKERLEDILNGYEDFED